MGCLNARSANTTANSSMNIDPEKITIQGLTFYTEVEPALLAAKIQKKPIFVYARSKYCGACKEFESESFTNASIMEQLNSKFILISIDVDEQPKETGDFRVRVTPTEIFLDSNGTEIKKLYGYRTNQTFLNEINKIV